MASGVGQEPDQRNWKKEGTDRWHWSQEPCGECVYRHQGDGSTRHGKGTSSVLRRVQDLAEPKDKGWPYRRELYFHELDGKPYQRKRAAGRPV